MFALIQSEPSLIGVVAGFCIGACAFALLDACLRRFGPRQHYPRRWLIIGGGALSAAAVYFISLVCALIPAVLFAGMMLAEIVSDRLSTRQDKHDCDDA